jgi:Fe-S oxidoreductase
VPEFRSKFLELYYGRYLRPAKDYLVATLESTLPLASYFPGAYNWMMGNPALQKLMRAKVGLVDSPKLSGIRLPEAIRERGIAWATPSELAALSASQREKAVIVVQDAFTSFFETQLVLDVIDLLRILGFVPLLAPFMPNGKPLQVHGFLNAFRRVARKNATSLRKIESEHVPLVGIDPSMTLTYRFEYAKALEEDAVPKVRLLQEWLAQQRDHLMDSRDRRKAGTSGLCLTARKEQLPPIPLKTGKSVFGALGHSLDVVNTGCCGMAGTYGHEAANAETSRKIYSLSWANVIGDAANDNVLLATGYSCRSQVKRMDNRRLQHPAQALLAAMRSSPTGVADQRAVVESRSISASDYRTHSISHGCCD